MILEGIVTTRNSDHTSNISPMGPIVDADMRHFVLRPFQSSTTYHNLKRNGEGVLHVTDDVLMIARAAIGELVPQPTMRKSACVEADIIETACRWYAFRVVALDDSQARTRIECEVIDQGRLRDFFGFNRAKHAVLEAAILATRVHIVPLDQIKDSLQDLGVIVNKTASEKEREAFQILEDYVARSARQKASSQ